MQRPGLKVSFLPLFFALHWATRNLHLFLYVRPFEPQTGGPFFVHLRAHGGFGPVSWEGEERRGTVSITPMRKRMYTNLVWLIVISCIKMTLFQSSRYSSSFTCIFLFFKSINARLSAYRNESNRKIFNDNPFTLIK